MSETALGATGVVTRTQSSCCLVLNVVPFFLTPHSTTRLARGPIPTRRPRAFASIATLVVARYWYRERHAAPSARARPRARNHALTATGGTHAPECTWMEAVLSGTPNEPVSTVSSWYGVTLPRPSGSVNRSMWGRL